MIINQKIKVKSSKYYKNIGYNIDEKYILIDIKDLPLGSHSIIEVRCDYCNIERTISYKDYNKNISTNGKFSCSIKCGCLKSKETNLEKYGVESVNQLNSKKIKSKKTLMNKYGVDHISKIEHIRKTKSIKMKDKSVDTSIRLINYWNSLTEEEKFMINKKRETTILEKYGEKNISKIDYIKDKVKDTVSDKYGGFTYQSNLLMSKVNSTNLEKYGFTNASKNENVKNKMFLTNIEKWGYKSPSMSDIIKKKVFQTNLDRIGVGNPMFLKEIVSDLKLKFYNKWGVDSYFKTEEFKISKLGNLLSDEQWRIKNTLIGSDINYISYLGNNKSKLKCDRGLYHDFEISSSNYHNRIRNILPLCTVCFPILENSSIKEIELRNFILSIYNGEIISSYRDGLEIDIYLPELKIGFEFNGLYWHSNEFKDKNYHLNKSEHFKEKGIRIIHIWEDDWTSKRNIIESQIKNILKINTKNIFARKCFIKEVNIKESKHFLDDNHIQGSVSSVIKIGLYFNDELVSLMTFNSFEGRKKMELGGYNLNRFCNLRNTNVIGGASKLLSYFKRQYNPLHIVSYADKDWSVGDLYYKLGFKNIGGNGPDYKYIVDNQRVHKSRYKKSKLKTTLTEAKQMEKDGFLKIYDCGKLKFELLIN